MRTTELHPSLEGRTGHDLVAFANLKFEESAEVIATQNIEYLYRVLGS